MSPIPPGSRIGVLGSGQLGRMFAIAARQMGYRVHTFSPDDDTPAGQVSDVEITAPWDDLDSVRAFASAVDVITFEFENVPAEAAQAAAERSPIRPSAEVLWTAQNRIREKTFLASRGFPVARFSVVESDAVVDPAIARIGAPAVLKSSDSGYDGKGQVRIDRPQDGLAAWHALGGRPCVLEEFVRFEKEISVVAARSESGAYADYGVIENVHSRHILDVSIAPADVSPALERQARELTRGILESLEVVGVVCVEMFVAAGGGLLVNEIAPRPHNSGHLTIDANACSQFEQQLRAICGLPLGSTERLRAAAMANLLGDLWGDGAPDFESALEDPIVRLHLYGKLQARPGRKMGHLTALDADPAEARRRVLAARAKLSARTAAEARP